MSDNRVLGEQNDKKVFYIFLFVTLAVGAIIFGLTAALFGGFVEHYIILFTFHTITTLLTFFIALKYNVQISKDYNFTRIKWFFACFILLAVFLFIFSSSRGGFNVAGIFLSSLINISLTVISSSSSFSIILFRRRNGVKIWRMDLILLIFTPLFLLTISYYTFIVAFARGMR